MKHEYLECGKIINKHGFRGAVKLESWCDTPADLARVGTYWFPEGDGYRPVRVRKSSVLGGFVLTELEGVETEEAADRLRGKVVYASRGEFPLPEGGYFLADVIGLPVRDADSGETIGTLTSVDTRGHANLFTVKTPRGEALVPDVPQFVTRVDIEDAVYIRPISGLLDDGEEPV